MGYDVYYQPTAKSLGMNALMAGLGQYNLKQQSRRDAQRSQERSIASSERMQQRGLAAQAKNYADLRAFQGSEAGKDRDQQLTRDMLRYGNAAEEFDRRIEASQGEQTRKFVNEGWQQFVGSVKNWGDFDEQQQMRWKEIEGGVREVMGNRAHTPEEKEMAIKQSIATAQGLLSTITPRAKTQQDEWNAKGQGVGMVWNDPKLGRVTRDNNLNVKALSRKMPSEIRLEGIKTIMDAHYNSMPDEGGKPLSIQEAMELYDNMTSQTQAQQTPLAAQAVGMTGADIGKVPPDMAMDYEDLLKRSGINK